MTEESESWILAADALRLLGDKFGSDDSVLLLLDRGAAGLVESRALVIGYSAAHGSDRGYEKAVPGILWKWMAEGLTTNPSWERGDFDVRGRHPEYGMMDVSIRGLQIAERSMLQLLGKVEDRTASAPARIEPLSVDPVPPRPPLVSDRTGAAGRPTSMHLVEQMMRERFEANAFCPKMSQEAAELERLFRARDEYKGLVAPKAKTIQNDLGSLYRSLKASLPK